MGKQIVVAETKKKRIVKNPETFREKAIKANANSEKPTRRSRVRAAGSKVGSPIAKPLRPVGRGLKFIFDRKPFRLIGRILWPVYFRNSVRELRQVEWPSIKQARDLTFAVLAFAIVFGGAIALVDYGLDKVFRTILLK